MDTAFSAIRPIRSIPAMLSKELRVPSVFSVLFVVSLPFG